MDDEHYGLYVNASAAFYWRIIICYPAATVILTCDGRMLTWFRPYHVHAYTTNRDDYTKVELP